MKCLVCSGSSTLKDRVSVRGGNERACLICRDCEVIQLLEYQDFDYKSDGYRREHHSRLDEEYRIENLHRDNLLLAKERLSFYLDRASIVGNKILDFGCADGAFLVCAKERGFDIVGIEVNEDSRQFLSEKDICCRASLEDVSEDIDTVTMFHVLEHVRDPMVLLRSLASRFSGCQLIIEVPNIDDILLQDPDCREIFKAFWFRDAHIFNFSLRSLEQFSEIFSEYSLGCRHEFGIANFFKWKYSLAGSNHSLQAFSTDIGKELGDHLLDTGSNEIDEIWKKTLSECGKGSSIFIEGRLK